MAAVISNMYGVGKHLSRHFVLLFISSCLLPLSFTVGLIFFTVRSNKSIFNQFTSVVTRKQNPKQRVLVTGENKSTTLAFARLANSAGYDVFFVGAINPTLLDFTCYSNAIVKTVGVPFDQYFTKIRRIKAKLSLLSSHMPVSIQTKLRTRSVNFSDTVLRLVQHENINLWMHCESADSRLVSRAKEAVTRQTTCRTFGPSLDISKLAKDYRAFSAFVGQLGQDIQTPKATHVSSRAEIHRILAAATKDQKFRLEKKESRRDSYFSGSTLGEEHSPVEPENDKVLPKSSLSETYSSVASMAISQEQPWILHETLFGRQIIVSCLVLNKTVRVYMARVSLNVRDFHFTDQSPTGGGHEAWSFVDPNATLGSKILSFARKFASHLPDHTTTHLNLHLILSEVSTSDGLIQTIRATSCDFRASVLLAQYAQSAISAQIPAPTKTKNFLLSDGKAETLILPRSSEVSSKEVGVYSFPLAVRSLVLTPAINCFFLRGSLMESMKGLIALSERMIYWKEDIFNLDDPWPWLLLWLVEMPVGLLLRSLSSSIPKMLR